MRTRPAILVAAWTVSLLGKAHADEESNRKLAVDLFDSGVRRMEEGKCEQAPVSDPLICRQARESFQRAFALYPSGLGALRNLAYVEKGLGLVASASRSFRELARRAPLDPKPARKLWAEYAERELVSLRPRVSHLTVIAPSGYGEHGAVIALDGEVLPPAAWGAALDVDAGDHRIEATQGARREARALNIAEGESKAVTLPPLDAPVAASPAAPTSGSKRVERSDRRPSLVPPMLLGSAGIVLMGIGASFGIRAIHTRKEACGDGHFCDPAALDDGRSQALRADVWMGLGAGATLGAGIWLWLGQRSKASEPTVALGKLEIQPMGWGMRAVGSF